MRIKKTYIVLSFRTTLDAMEWEKQCLAEKVPGRLIPLPREISAGCGLPGGCCRKNLSSGRTGWTRHVTIRPQQ